MHQLRADKATNSQTAGYARRCTPFMRNFLIIALLTIASCVNEPASKARHFSTNLPDTSTTWSGRRTRETFLTTRQFEKKLKLNSLQDGTLQTEFRIWNFSGSVDPQGLTILRSTINQNWQLRQLTFNYRNPDSLISDINFTFNLNSSDSLQLDRLWHLNSQSDLKNGDQFGCLDGNIIFIELSDWNRYRFCWYNCPSINRDRNPVFLEVTELLNTIHKFSDRSK